MAPCCCVATLQDITGDKMLAYSVAVSFVLDWSPNLAAERRVISWAVRGAAWTSSVEALVSFQQIPALLQEGPLLKAAAWQRRHELSREIRPRTAGNKRNNRLDFNETK